MGVNYKAESLWRYVYEFKGARNVQSCLPLLQVGIVDTGSEMSQCGGLKNDPYNVKPMGHVKSIDSTGDVTNHDVALGVARAVAHVIPKKLDGNPTKLRDWQKTQDSPIWMNDDSHKEKMLDIARGVEPISLSGGPILIGNTNLKRWGLTVHPLNGLVPVA